VDDGVYVGSFRILKPVTLTGTSKAAVIQTEYTAPGPRGIWVESSDVIIENLTIKARGRASPPRSRTSRTPRSPARSTSRT